MTTVNEVQDRISSRKAKVYTAAEFKEMVRRGSRPALEDVDVVTCGTLGVMSGTMAILSVPVAAPGAFRRAESITLNGVPGNVGPCPNESLGLVDCTVNGTEHRDAEYGGGHLFRDLVARKPVEVVAVAEGREYSRTLTLDEIPFARLMTTRGAFRNYTCFDNPSDEPYRTIFSGPEPLQGNSSEASVSGCGELSPVQNDPNLDYLRPGSSVLLNGAPGFVLGTGTRSSPDKPNLSMMADMHLMRADYMGGFVTSAGPECLTSVAVAFPITGEKALDDVSVLDEEVPMPLADAHDRKPVYQDVYASAWQGTDRDVSCDHSKCLRCADCRADRLCPTGAHPSEGIDRGLCVSCGFCVKTCVGGVFSADLGSADFGGKRIPITVRQSSRSKAEELCGILKGMVEDGQWNLRCFDGRL